MNPEESPQATEAVPQATVLDGLITCPHCSGWIESSVDCAGQIVACPHCAGHFQLHESIERGFVPPPVHPVGLPPKEPWFYGFIDTYARAWMWFSLLAGTLGFLGAASAAFSSSRAPFSIKDDHSLLIAIVIVVVIVWLAFWLLGILLSVAFMHLAVDIGRTLRAIRQHAPDHRGH